MNLFHKLLNLIYPPRCMFCHSFLKGKEQGMCSSCRASLPVLAERDRVQSLAGVSACSSLFRYEGNVRQSLHRYKFSGLSYYGSEFAAMMAVYMTDSELACDIVTWVPLSRARMRSRGYDQAGLIAAYGLLDATFKAYRAQQEPDIDVITMQDIRKDAVEKQLPEIMEKCPGEGYILWKDDFKTIFVPSSV